MYMSAVCLQGEASRTGFEIIHIANREASRTRLDLGDHVWTENAKTRYELLSRTDEADEATIAILNAKTDYQIGAFTSKYGPLHFARQYNGGECTPLAELHRMVGDLRHLDDMLRIGDFSEANPLPNGLVMSPFAVAFNLRLVPADNLRGFSAMFTTYSLYSFLVHELITRALGNRPLLVCNDCGDYQRLARRDSKFCSGRCRTANFRKVHDEQEPARP